MKRQVLKMTNNGTWTVIRDDNAKINPYKIYHIVFENGKKRRKKKSECPDFYSCLNYLALREDD